MGQTMALYASSSLAAEIRIAANDQPPMVRWEPLGVAIHAVDVGKLKAGMSIGVFGCGPIGLLIIQLARLSGAAQVIATDKLVHRVEAAKKFGATQAFLADKASGSGDPLVNRVDVAFEVASRAHDGAFAGPPGGKVILRSQRMTELRFPRRQRGERD
jgi:L-iditol 2-dehydrogenase